MELTNDKFVNDVYMDDKDFEGRVIDIPGVDKEYFQDLSRKLAEDDPSWLTPERKKSFGL